MRGQDIREEEREENDRYRLGKYRKKGCERCMKRKKGLDRKKERRRERRMKGILKMGKRTALERMKKRKRSASISVVNHSHLINSTLLVAPLSSR